MLSPQLAKPKKLLGCGRGMAGVEKERERGKKQTNPEKQSSLVSAILLIVIFSEGSPGACPRPPPAGRSSGNPRADC